MTKVNEEDETAIKKPIARRPGLSHHKSLSELLSDAVKDSSPADVSETAVIAIRPKTFRFKPTGKVEMLAPKSNDASNLVYKPIAKFVTSATLSVLASLGSNVINSRRENTEVGSSIKISELMRNDLLVNSKEDKSFLLPSNNEERASSDGHSWRKYGQKQVKGSEYPRSYYKCTYPNCLAKKMVERTLDEQIAEVVYKGEHSHSKPLGPACDTAQIEVNSSVSNNQKADRIEGLTSESKDQITIESFTQSDFLGASPRINETVMDVLFDGSASTSNDADKGEWEEGSEALEAEDDGFKSKRRKCQIQSLKACSAEKGTPEPGNGVQNNADSDIIGDGFRWRKYGQKVVKGNSYPRSYYKCTSPKCNVRKYVERTSEDPSTFITTYEGRHNHEMPIKIANSEASNTRTRNKS
ncbi:WRKY transcription factor 44-like [Primulina eburnea]|uniref:WRKY transcription factor 44-like n=1 Tax=Primulina eburnea TaxID=1245227 RepID=UPI003C6BD681